MPLSPNDLRIPKDWDILAGADTGTYMGGAICALDPNWHLYVLEEFPNYSYTGDGTIELTGMTVGEWFRWFGTRLQHYTNSRRNQAWVDYNTTFKTEVSHGLTLRGNTKHLELRTEITREYLRNDRLHLMPWLKVIPYEMEECKYPDHESAGTGRLVRIKSKDHCWDGVEHVASRRPHPSFGKEPKQAKSAIQQLIDRNLQQHKVFGARIDPHLGQN